MTPEVRPAGSLARRLVPVESGTLEVTARTTPWRSAAAAAAPAQPAPGAPPAVTADEAVTEHTVAGDAVADRAVVDHAVADHAVADEAVTEHSAAGGAVARDAVARDAVADHAIADHAVADHAIADHAVAPLGLTPAVEREIFQLARRIALQADLAAAMRVLRPGLARLTDSSDAACILEPALASAWAAADGSAARPLDDELRQLAAEVAGSGRPAGRAHALAEPVGPLPVRAVLAVRRAPTDAPYGDADAATLAAVASALAGLVGHFAADHAARRDQAARDARSPFRVEALAAHRGAVAAPGRPVAPPRTWMRWAYPTLIGLVVVLVTATAVIQVPTYSTGVSIVTVEGEQVTPPAPGTVAELLVAPGTRVAAGDAVLRLHAVDEDTELAATETDYRNALSSFLTSPGDSAARVALATVATRRQRARAGVDARTLRAPIAGIVGDIRVRPGQLVAAGAPVMKIAPSPNLSVIAVLPGTDRPRLAAGMTLQIELPGYHKRREEAVIDTIGTQVIGPEEARRSLGAQIGDALPINGPVVLVRGHLTTRTFESDGREYAFYDGMVGKAEVRVDTSRLLRLLLPGKRK